MENNNGKIHYRRAFDSPYLSSADIVGVTSLTISKVVLELDHTKRTKDLNNTAYFKESELRPGEKLKPMILNATNSRQVKEFAGSPFIDDWVNIPVSIYVKDDVRFGRDTVEGLRISPQQPAMSKPVLTPDNKVVWGKAKASLAKYGSLDKVLPVYDISPENQAKIIMEVKQEDQGGTDA